MVRPEKSMQTSVATSKVDPAEPAPSPHKVVIEARSGLGHGLGELIERRELLYFLVWRDIKVRYKQTALGVAWAVLLPLFQAIVFTVIFGKLAGLKPDGPYPYSVFVLAGLIPWTFFSQAVIQGSQSLVNQQHLLTKVYFPRLFVPAAAVGGCLVDFVIGFALYGAVLAYYGVLPPVQALLVPVLMALTVAAAAGIVFFLSALTVTYRDFRYVVPFAVQAMMYVSPIVYPVKLFPEQYRWILGINPMAGLIDAYRSAILRKPWDLELLMVSSISLLLCVIVGLVYFRRTERRFADIA
jgi:lipopolysaccharide transport system permease protein